jgi:hypothetical protein
MLSLRVLHFCQVDNYQEAYRLFDKSLFRPTEIEVGRGDASKAAQVLKWRAKTKMPEVAKRLVEACAKELEGPRTLVSRLNPEVLRLDRRGKYLVARASRAEARFRLDVNEAEMAMAL